MLKKIHISDQYIDSQETLKDQRTNKRKKIDSIRFIDLFSGIGGFRLGFDRPFSSCVFSSEWDKFAVETYKANFKDHPAGDITTIHPESIPDFEILLAGFPCQPFSSIGKRQGFKHKTQGTLFYNIAEILRVKKPAAFILENVVGLKTHMSGDESTLTIITDTLQELNYDINIQILDSSDFGLPQKRKRIFIVGFLRENFPFLSGFKFPKPKGEKVFVNSILEKNISGYSISKHLQKTYMFKIDDGRPELVDENSTFQAKTLVSTYHKIQRLTGTFVKGGETGMRLLSEKECKRLMGFPDNFIIPVSRTQMYRQFGNSVAVPVVNAIADEVYKTLACIYEVKDKIEISEKTAVL